MLRCLVEVRNPVPVFEVVSWLVYIVFLVSGVESHQQLRGIVRRQR